MPSNQVDADDASAQQAPAGAASRQAVTNFLQPYVITESYASSETGLATFVDSPTSLERPGTAGRMMPNGRIQILDEAGRPLPAGQVGTIYVR